MQREPKDDSFRIDMLYRRCLSRLPNAAERATIVSLLADERRSGLNDRDAWTTVARVLLNLDEFITRE